VIEQRKHPIQTEALRALPQGIAVGPIGMGANAFLGKTDPILYPDAYPYSRFFLIIPFGQL
jgi:hypothetical protein